MTRSLRSWAQHSDGHADAPSTELWARAQHGAGNGPCYRPAPATSASLTPNANRRYHAKSLPHGDRRVEMENGAPRAAAAFQWAPGAEC